MTDEPSIRPAAPESQHDPDADPDMLTSTTTQTDQAEGEADDPAETKDDGGSDR
ncbi:hypothetical protein GOAMI_33_00360 [Gordonia amicalis NBRC 100051 = JCM 11271]|nr:hypothetical protein GOAMI_33_00360 [Gordonia amicalis NBRC 100051 = JCM 11271]